MSRFKTVQFMTADQKEKILKLWIRFLKNNFERQDFTKELYHYLSQNAGFIAHYNAHGFYSEYFERGEDKIRFLAHFDLKKMRGNYLCDLDLSGDYGDLNAAMVEEAAKYLPVLYAGAAAEQKQLDLRIAEALLAKHGLTLANAVKPAGNVIAPVPAAVQTSLFG